jgi:hypothetical protein
MSVFDLPGTIRQLYLGRSEPETIRPGETNKPLRFYPTSCVLAQHTVHTNWSLIGDTGLYFERLNSRGQIA